MKMNCVQDFKPGDVLIGLQQVLGIMGISKSQIYRLTAEDIFPSPIKIGKHRVAWIEAEVHAYLTQRIQQRNKKYFNNGENYV